jgi:histidine ammonia-lyase
VLAIEIMTAARGVELRAPLRPAAATGAAITALRTKVDGPGPDRFLTPDIEAATALVRDGSILAAAHARASAR